MNPVARPFAFPGVDEKKDEATGNETYPPARYFSVPDATGKPCKHNPLSLETHHGDHHWH